MALSGITFSLLPHLLSHAAPYIHASFLRDSIPTLDERINATLCPSATVSGSVLHTPCVYNFVAPDIPSPQYVRRDDITAAIIRVVTGNTFAVIEGPNRVGKSAAVKIAASELSRARCVRRVECLDSHGVVDVLAALLLADQHDARWQANLPTTYRPALALPTYEDFHVAMLRRPRQNPEPVFVVETAEHLSVSVLLTLLSFGKCCTGKVLLTSRTGQPRACFVCSQRTRRCLRWPLRFCLFTVCKTQRNRRVLRPYTCYCHLSW